ncbi:hypothetical protein [Dactylosporangium darangshiense]|uniref:Uncharacterized protein n=1 Tax=Dactylosporangium darangshiense TaxID=579108 RepID=A0ABP8DTE8_9ACTN
MGPRRDDLRPWDGAHRSSLDAPARVAIAVLAPLIVATVVAVAVVGLAVSGHL